MKGLKIALISLTAALSGVGIALLVTNPNPDDYEVYATAALTEYLREEGAEVCEDAPTFLGNSLEDQCLSLLNNALENNQTQIQTIISNSTQRRNYWFLSIYVTRFEFLDEILPTYEFETLGVFQNFYTYHAKRED